VFTQDAATQLVVGRLLDFFDHRTVWQRSLWTVSSALALREVLEYGESVRIEKVPRQGLEYVRRVAEEQCSLDPGVGGAELRRHLSALLGAKPDEPATAAAIEHLGARATMDYLARWGRYLAATRSCWPPWRLVRPEPR